LDTSNDRGNSTKNAKKPPSKSAGKNQGLSAGNRQSKTNAMSNNLNSVISASTVMTVATPGAMRKGGSINQIIRQSLDADMSSSQSSSGQSLEAEVASLQWRLKEREAELAEKDKLIASLTNRVSDLNRAVEESDTIRAQQVTNLFFLFLFLFISFILSFSFGVFSVLFLHMI
jgi:CII-binding regulator of phage lambda lysogenization HflD